MAHHASKRPCVSVVMAIHDGDRHLVRSMESILNQSFSDFELICVDCDSSDRTPSILERFRDRDIRVDILTSASDDVSAGLVAGIDEARGFYLMLVRPDDWLAPEMLGQLVRPALEEDLDMVLPPRSEDVWDARERSCESKLRRASASTWTTRAALRHAVGNLYEGGLLSQAGGILVERERALSGRLSLSGDDDGFGYVIACLEDAESLGVTQDACYHAVTFGTKGNVPFDPTFADRCSSEHRQMMELVSRWGLDHDLDVVVPVHRRHVTRLIQCIDNASVGHSRISSIERIGRVQDMLDSEDARASLAAVEPAASDFGIMYKPMSKRNAAGCCMGARLRELARISHLPLGPIL